MARTALQYKQLLKSLFPKGRAWNKEEGSNLDQYCYALGEEFSRLEARQEDLNREVHVNLAVELLDEHEEDFAIPTDSSLSVEDRQSALRTKLLSVGGMSPEYYLDLLYEAGYDCLLEEYTPAWVGKVAVGDPVGGQKIIFCFTIYLRIGIDRGEVDLGFDRAFSRIEPNDISIYQNYKRDIQKIIELIRDIKPSHMHDFYNFYEPAFSRAFDFSFDSIPTNDDSVPIVQFGSGFASSFPSPHGYDGSYLIGSFSNAFDLALDAHYGGEFENSAFDNNFMKQS
jgi:uncharacterized protein YmfQ (DUF2313 family)